MTLNVNSLGFHWKVPQFLSFFADKFDVEIWRGSFEPKRQSMGVVAINQKHKNSEQYI